MTGAIAGPCDAGVAASAEPCVHAHPKATLAATILGSSLTFIDSSVVNVALPAMGQDLAAAPSQLPWMINAYLLPLGALVLFGGALGDRFGRRRLFLIGVAVFVAASMLCALAPSSAALLAGRALQGLGAALVTPNSLAILGGAFTGEARGRAIGAWAATGALAGAVAPLLGGWLVDAVGWRFIFLINAPIGLVAAALAYRYVAETRDRSAAPSLDVGGAALVTASLGLLTWSLTAATEPGVSGALTGATGLLGLGLLAAFVGVERRLGAHALMPLALFSTRMFVGLTLVTFFLYASLGGLLTILPFLLVRIAGYASAEAGAALLPLPILIGLGSPLMGALSARFGPRPLLAAGSGLVALGFATLTRLPGADLTYAVDVLPAVVLVALGLAVSVAPLTAAVMASVDADHVGAASGFNSAVARVGGLIAAAALASVFALEATPDAFMAGVHAAAAVGAALAAIAALSALALAHNDAPVPAGTDAPR